MKRLIQLPFYGSLAVALLLLLNFGSYAQNTGVGKTIKGNVSDKESGITIIGAVVTEIDKEGRIVNGANTDLDGNFVLKVANPANKLAVSFIGYKKIVQEIGGRTVFNFKLESSANQLQEVVVVARQTSSNGLMEVEKRSSTVSVAKIDARELEEMSSSSIDQAIQGRLPGVDIAANSGDPGAGMQIRIRGTSTINGSSDPLIVVDGMPFETEIPSDFNFGTADDQGYATLLNIAPSDIMEIAVLKDAAATAVWGSRASNGVLLITTKRGRVGKPAVTYTFRGTMAKQPQPIPMLTGDQFSMLIPEAVMNRNGAPLNTEQVKEFLYDISDPYYYYNYGTNTDWLDLITQTGYKHDHNLSLSGGGEKARYYASVGYLDETGTTLGTGLSRISTRINLDYDVSSRLRFRTDIAYTNTDTDRNYSNNARSIAYDKMPNMSVYEYDLQGNNTGLYLSPLRNIQGEYPRTYNPLALLTMGINNVRSERIIPKFNLQYDIVPDLLRTTFDVQFDIDNTKSSTFLPQLATGRPMSETVVNRAYDGDVDRFGIQTKTNLIYTPKLGENHSLIGLVSFLSDDNKVSSVQLQSSNSASAFLQDPSAAARIQGMSSGYSHGRSVALLGNVQYSYLDRYIFNAALRGDGNSKFGPDNRYAAFPSLSTRWRVSGEPFMQQFGFINDLSLRASFGQSGRAPRNNYSFYSVYGNYDWDYIGGPAVYPQNMELSTLRWETVTGHNAGFNLIMFKNRFDVDVDFYRMRTTDLYFPDLQLPGISGYSSINMNVGTMDNQGWEVNIQGTPIKTKDWTVDLNFNISRNVNIIREISEFYPREKGNSAANGQYKSFLQENTPFGSFFGYRYKGVYSDAEATVARDKDGNAIVGLDGEPLFMRFNYPYTDYIFQPGDAMYEDINHDGNIDYRDVVYLGNGNPKFIGGFGPTITYKSRLKLTAFFSFRTKYQIVNGTQMNTTNMYGYDNQSTAVLRRWRNPGDQTDMPRALWNSGYNWLGSDRYVEDASFVRLRALTARYALGKNALSKIKMKNASVYVTAENLLTFTNYTGQDPEVSTRGTDPFRVAIDNSMTPPTKNIVLGFSVGF
ncbi:SusC/RagA family TonB-linked outer membrane protein [Botryobacter ruber]|uniref:SusC/RagA family TonB-linked outer membrane protein n=1 Tax=Botryobacter ruber TaxID=2171629 RepID=UPI000E0AE79E|nr:SusC/RagA family TonB-linked outer membrane protein [Botryobacter ruber]